MPAPIDSPISNGPINGSSAPEPINKGEADFDQQSHAAKANQEYLDQMAATHDAEIRRLQEDSEARTQSLRDEINAMRSDVATARETAAAAVASRRQEPAPNLEDKYRLSEEESENYGDMMSAVDKRAALFAEKAHNAAFDKASQLFATERDQLRTEIENLKDQVSKASQGVVQNFESSARARAGNYGLDLDNLERDTDWQNLMSQPVSAVNDMTYSEYVQAAVKTSDMRSLEKVFAYFANDFKRPDGNSLTGLPNANQARTNLQQPTHQEPVGEQIMVQLQSLENDRASLRDNLNRGRITIDAFTAKLEEIDKQVIDLRNKLT